MFLSSISVNVSAYLRGSQLSYPYKGLEDPSPVLYYKDNMTEYLPGRRPNTRGPSARTKPTKFPTNFSRATESPLVMEDVQLQGQDTQQHPGLGKQISASRGIPTMLQTVKRTGIPAQAVPKTTIPGLLPSANPFSKTVPPRVISDPPIPVPTQLHAPKFSNGLRQVAMPQASQSSIFQGTYETANTSVPRRLPQQQHTSNQFKEHQFIRDTEVTQTGCYRQVRGIHIQISSDPDYEESNIRSESSDSFVSCRQISSDSTMEEAQYPGLEMIDQDMDAGAYEDAFGNSEDMVETANSQQDINDGSMGVTHKTSHKKLPGLLLPADGSDPVDLRDLFDNYLWKTQDWTRDRVITILSNPESSIDERLDAGVFYSAGAEAEDNNVLQIRGRQRKIDQKIRLHMFILQTPLFIPGIILHCVDNPALFDTRSDEFRKLREYAKVRYTNIKHKFLRGTLYDWCQAFYRERVSLFSGENHPTQFMQYDELQTLYYGHLEGQMNGNTFRAVFAYIADLIDYEETFRRGTNESEEMFFYLDNMFKTLAVCILNIISTEHELNGTIPPKPTPYKGWKKDSFGWGLLETIWQEMSEDKDYCGIKYEYLVLSTPVLPAPASLPTIRSRASMIRTRKTPAQPSSGVPPNHHLRPLSKQGSRGRSTHRTSPFISRTSSSTITRSPRSLALLSHFKETPQRASILASSPGQRVESPSSLSLPHVSIIVQSSTLPQQSHLMSARSAGAAVSCSHPSSDLNPDRYQDMGVTDHHNSLHQRDICDFDPNTRSSQPPAPHPIPSPHPQLSSPQVNASVYTRTTRQGKRTKERGAGTQQVARRTRSALALSPKKSRAKLIGKRGTDLTTPRRSTRLKKG